MNAEVYLFGDLGEGYTQYVDDSTRALFRSMVSKAKANSQLIIYREDTLMYYTYIRRLRSAESSNRYIGISYALNNRFISDFDGLFTIFEGAVTTIVSRGVILEYTNDGDITSSLGKIHKAKSEFAQISAYLKAEFDTFMAGKNDTLPLLDYSINTSETKSFHHTDSKSEIIKALSTFPNVIIIKDNDYESAESKSYASTLHRLNKENTNLKEANKKLTQQKKQIKVVAWLSVIIAIGVVIFFFVIQSKNDDIWNLTQRNNKLTFHVENLQRDSTKLSHTLYDTNQKLTKQIARANRLQADSSRLTTVNTRLQKDLETANKNISAYRQTVEQKDKLIKEKDRQISNLQTQLKNAQKTTTTTSPITISSISIASTKRNGNIANDFGKYLYASDSYYIKVKMTYKCTSTGYKNLTIKLYGPSSYGMSWYNSETENVYLYSSSTHTFSKLLGKSGNRLQKGSYKVEICYDGKVLNSQSFTLY